MSDLRLDYVEHTGPMTRVGVITDSDDEEAVAAFAQDQVGGTTQWPDLQRDDSGHGWVATFERAYL